MDIDIAIRIFAKFLNTSWDIVNPLLIKREYTTDDFSINNWMQANWEILIERKILPINEYLEIYGDGADFTGVSSRMTDITVSPTFLIIVIVKDKRDYLNNVIINNGKLLFDRLVGFIDGFYTDYPPFTKVLVYDEQSKIERVFSMNDVLFEVVHY